VVGVDELPVVVVVVVGLALPTAPCPAAGVFKTEVLSPDFRFRLLA
jgi:hypothetical protein